jgi:small subunit ribosomal protein S6
MRRYETIFIVDNDLSEEDRSPIFEKLKDLIHQHNGLLVMFDEWGGKKLAYEIKKKARGYYVRLDYCGSGVLVNEIERFFRIDDRILKYMTVLLNKDANIEAVKEEMAKAQGSQIEETEVSDDESSPVNETEPEALEK